MRKFNRKNDDPREILLETNFIDSADGSCLVGYGETKVICTASIDENIPGWLKDKNSGWITAEYGMLPASTDSRNRRESKSGKQSGRSVEIQRLIGRSLRSVVDLNKLSGYQIIIDCDVIKADGGTRTASITGGFVALDIALKKLIKNHLLKNNPIKDFIAAISCGIVNGDIMVDLDYSEDSIADVDANFVIARNSGFSELQISGEEKTFTQEDIVKMLEKSTTTAKKIFQIQENVIKKTKI